MTSLTADNARALVSTELAVSNLCKTLAQSADLSICMLIDPGLADPFKGWVQLEDRRLPIKVPGVAARQSPYLVLLQTADAVDLRLLQQGAELSVAEACGECDTEEASARSIAAFMVAQGQHWRTRAAGLELAQGLGKLASWPQSPGLGFRYWDPRITADLDWVFATTRWSDALHVLGVHQWFCFDVDTSDFRDLLVLHSAAGNPVASGWPADAKSEQRLAVLTWRNLVMRLAKRWTLLSPVSAVRARAVVERAVALGLSSEDDVVRFAHGVFALHRQFERHPRVQAILREAAALGPGAFAHAMRQTDDATLQAMQVDDWLANLPANAA